VAAVPSYRIGQAAEVLGVSADTVRRWVDAGRLAAQRDNAGQRLVDGASLAVLAVQLHEEALAGRGTSSARNSLPGIVTKVTRDAVAAQVELQAGPPRIVSLMTREAADELGLAPGVLATAVVKATTVVVELPSR
jgi:molybdopterin-binding protein